MSGLKDTAFVCLWWGDKYTHEYVNKLYRAVRRNCTYDLPFLCLSDRSPDGLKRIGRLFKGIYFIKTPNTLPGWWQKINLFERKTTGYRYLIYIDLDVVILKSIDDIVSMVGQYEFVYAQDLIDELSSSFMVIDTESRFSTSLVADFDAKIWAREEDGDQDYLRTRIDPLKYPIKALSPEDHYSYKYLTGLWDEEVFNASYEPVSLESVRSLNFHGNPKPQDLMENPRKFPLASSIIQAWI